MKSPSLRELLSLVLVSGFIVFTLAPVVARLDRSPADAKCQSNLHRLGEAMALYVADNNGRYPTNRAYTGSSHSLGAINKLVALSPPEIDSATGKPRVFDYGITWVEGLYPYLWKSADKTGQDWRSYLRCPASSIASDPTDPNYNCATSYVFNGCLAEYWPGVARNSQKLMMIRELGKLTASALRPTNINSTGNPDVVPYYAFLNNKDHGPNTTDTSTVCKPHGGGSYILFADGHVKQFTLDYFPEFKSSYNTSTAWDSTTQQWYNYNKNPVKPLQYRVTIAVTP